MVVMFSTLFPHIILLLLFLEEKRLLLHEHGFVYIIVFQNGSLKCTYNESFRFLNFQTLHLPAVCVVKENAAAYGKEFLKMKAIDFSTC